jgi:lipoate synthase
MTYLDLTSLTKQQLTALLWELKGTPAVHPIYQEIRTRSPEITIEISDPDWESKTDEALKQALGLATPVSEGNV